MAFCTELRLQAFFRPPPASHDPSSNVIHLHWRHCRRVSRRTNYGIRPTTEDEPVGRSRFSQFGFRFEPLSDFRHQIWISIASLNFPLPLCNFLYQNITSFIIDLTAERPTRLCPSFVILADINFVQKLRVDYTLRPRQLGPAGFVDETFILGTSTDGRSGARGRHQRFRGRNFHAPAEVDEDSDAEIEMLKRIKLGHWVVGGGGEETCSVCLEDLSEGQEVMTMACKHTYHEQCLLTWLDRNLTCPLCRRPI